MDILNVLQKVSNIKVDLVEDDFPHVKEVDTKLIELAKQMDAKVLTNDFNLNKVAGIQGVRVLNINDLCNALKPVVLPGETIRVFVLKEGKEAGQGVAYLDDGTMVVVDHAKRWIGKNADVFITGDFKYHEFFDAENKIMIADIGHYESEQFTSHRLKAILMEKFANFAVHLTEVNTNPINYF